MMEWFDERYISREEHDQIVAFYRKLVGRLYGDVRDLRRQVTDQAATGIPEDIAPPQPPVPPLTEAVDNVIHVDFARRS